MSDRKFWRLLVVLVVLFLGGTVLAFVGLHWIHPGLSLFVAGVALAFCALCWSAALFERS